MDLNKLNTENLNSVSAGVKFNSKNTARYNAMQKMDLLESYLTDLCNEFNYAEKVGDKVAMAKATKEMNETIKLQKYWSSVYSENCYIIEINE